MPEFKENPNARSPMYKMKGNPIQRNFPGMTVADVRSPVRHSGAEYDAATKKETKSGRGISPGTKKAHDEGHKNKWDSDHKDKTKTKTKNNSTNTTNNKPTDTSTKKTDE